MKAIVEQETARRKALYDKALAMFQPVIDVITTARHEGANVSLTLQPPSTRSAKAVDGTLWCRSFHDGVGQEPRNYTISISPDAGTCTVQTYLKLSELSEDDYQDYVTKYEKESGERFEPSEESDPDVVSWRRDYVEAGEPWQTIAGLRESIEEALITELAERKGGLWPLKIG
jgi:hypothetical protein